MSTNLVGQGVVEWAQRTPERVAVADLQRRITFAELDARAGAVAARLTERVADRSAARAWLPILVRRDAMSMVAVHAAIRAGFPIAVLDFDTPPLRLAAILQRLGNPELALVTVSDDASQLPGVADVVEVDGITGDPLDPVDVDLAADAYVIFTSGSTGVPKGVVHPWASFNFGVEVQRDREGTSSGAPEHKSLLSPLSFTAGLNRVSEMATGRSFAITDPNAMSTRELADWMDRERFDVIGLVPSMAEVMLDQWDAGRRLDSVERIRTFGEPLRWDQVPALRRLTRDDVIIEVTYGASESPMAPMVMEIPGDMLLDTGPVPLGRPVRQGRVELASRTDLGDELSEIIVTAHVASRYLGDERLTAERFFIDAEGRRCWRSGDLVSVRPDGLLVHRGRVDNMVKINGQLAEPAEAERVLRTLPGIAAAAVLPHTTPSGSVRLVGHLVLDHRLTTDPSAVRSSLRRELPPHLVPLILVVHDAFPLTHRGKLDQGRLRALAPTPWRSETSPVAPTDELERRIAMSVSQVLGLDRVGATENFFELGGDSLRAQRLCGVLARLDIADLPASLVVAHPTVRELAALIRSGEADAWACLVPLGIDGGRPPLICFHAASGEGILYGPLAEQFGADQPVYALQAETLTGRRPRWRTVEEMAAGLCEELVAQVPNGPYIVFGQSFGGLLAFEAARWLRASGREVPLVVLGDTSLPGRRRRLRRWSIRWILLGDERSKGRLRKVRGRLRLAVTHGAKIAVTRCCWLLRRPVPVRIRPWYVGWIIWGAIHRYRPQAESGRVVLFRSTTPDPDPLRGWGTVIDEVDVVQLDCDHFAVVRGEQLPVTAALLGEQIDRVIEHVVVET